jgi:hypothetical protein
MSTHSWRTLRTACSSRFFLRTSPLFAYPFPNAIGHVAVWVRLLPYKNGQARLSCSPPCLFTGCRAGGGHSSSCGHGKCGIQRKRGGWASHHSFLFLEGSFMEHGLRVCGGAMCVRSRWGGWGCRRWAGRREASSLQVGEPRSPAL